jgi:hypothetical protein
MVVTLQAVLLAKPRRFPCLLLTRVAYDTCMQAGRFQCCHKGCLCCTRTHEHHLEIRLADKTCTATARKQHAIEESTWL